MKYIVSVVLFSIFSTNTYAQYLKGKVIDSKGEPIVSVSIFIKENKQGLICNSNGEFQATLSPNTYHLEFHCLGYKSQEKELLIESSTEVTNLIITLISKDIELGEAVVSNKEDPAYKIMRQAIKKAPFYLSQVKKTEYEVYIKGSGKATQIPKIIETLSGEKLRFYKDKLFLQESFSEVKFTAPDKYEQTVKAFSSSMPNDFDPKESMRASTLSLYSPMYGQYLSPLNPKAFSYYKFSYEDFEEVDGQVVNKIKIIPKLKDPKLMEGYLYIADDDWNIRHAELNTRSTGMTIRYDLNYNRVAENVFLLTSYTGQVKANLLGLKFEFDYLSSTKYNRIELNDSLITAEKKKQPIEKKKKEKKNLEIKRDEKVKITADSLATKQDSVYWGTIRTVTLNEEEIKSYIRKDTIQAHVDSVRKEELNPRFSPMDLIMGGRFGGDSSRIYFKYEGLLIGGLKEYNFVDGFWMGQGVEIGIRKDSLSFFKIKPAAYWTTARKRLVWDLDFSFDYAPRRLGNFSLTLGSYTKDFAGESGVSRLINMSYTLFAGNNIARFYQKDFVAINNKIDLANGLQLELDLEIANRKQLNNYTTYSFFGDKNEAKPNIPEYSGSLHSEYNQLAKYSLLIQYTPEHYYWIEKGKKRYRHSKFPTFRFQFTQGVPTWLENHSIFQRWDLGVNQTIKLGLFNHLSYFINAGGFLNSETKSFNYIDYKHFNTSNQVIVGKDFFNSYLLLDYYTYATNKNWLEVKAAYTSEYLLLKRLSFLQGKLMEEYLHAKFLHTPDKPAYSEWSYSVGLSGLATVGVIASFDKTKFNAAGIRLSIPLIKEIGMKR